MGCERSVFFLRFLCFACDVMLRVGSCYIYYSRYLCAESFFFFCRFSYDVVIMRDGEEMGREGTIPVGLYGDVFV